MALALAGEASAGRIVGKDGVIHACYKAGGKGKGNIRLVAKRMHCRRNERKLQWSVRGPAGPGGANGIGGADGQAGATGEAGKAGLESKVAELTTRVETLEGILKGVSNDSLTKAVAAVPVVESVCEQTETLTGAFDALRSGIGNIEVLGVKLGVLALPGALGSYVCKP